MQATDTTASPPVTVSAIIAYCAYENKMQENVYPSRIKAKKMKAETARLNYKIIRGLGRLAAALQERGIGWEALVRLVDEMPKAIPTNE